MPPSALHAIQARTAIVIPCKDECVARIAGVWGAIPPPSLIVLVSGSSSPARFARERDALAAFCRLTGRRGLAVHQRDPEVAAALREAGMGALLMERRRQQGAPTTSPGGDDRRCADGDSGGDLEEETVHMGKGEGLVIGIALAATARGPPCGATACCGCGRGGGGGGGASRCFDDYRCGTVYDNSIQRTFEEYDQQEERMRYCHGGGRDGQDTKRPTDANAGGALGYYKYIGFIDADNFVPVSVEEYCRAFSTGLYLAQAEDAMVRISWPSKPKVRNGELDFSQSGRSSEIVNRWLNGLLGKMDGVSIETRAGAGGADGLGGGFGAACAAAMMGYEVPTAADDLICTGNAGEHAMTISLALKLRLASGYAIEPFHFLDIFERFAGPSDDGIDATTTTAAAAAAGITTTDVVCTAGIAGSKQQHDDFAADLLPSSPISLPTTLTSPVTMPTTPVGSGSPRLSACASPSSSSSSSSTSSSSRDSTSSPTTTHAGLPSSPSSLPPPLSPLSLSPLCSSSSSSRSSSLGVGLKTMPAVRQQQPPRVQILQIRPLSPHFHENKGEAHVERMWKQGLSAVYYSPVTATPGLARYREELRSTIFRGGDEEMMMKKKKTKSGCDENDHGAGVGHDPMSSLPTPPLSSSGSEATTPASEDGVGGVLLGDDGEGVGDEGAAVLAAAGWQPERCRVYPPAGSMRLEAFRARLETGSGSFWWNEKAVRQKPSQQSPGLLGFDSIAVLGLGPVSRERRPEGDVDGFRACVDETERR